MAGPAGRWIDAEAEAEIGWLVDLVTEVRQLKAEMNVPPAAKPPLFFVAPDAVTAGRISLHQPLILTLARVSEVTTAQVAPAGAVSFVIGGVTAAISLAGTIDVAAEKARLEKAIKAAVSDVEHINKKLGNPNFVAKAAPAVIDEQRAKLAEAEEAHAKLVAALERIGSLA
jgi:valyl-tRNA synthetase